MTTPTPGITRGLRALLAAIHDLPRGTTVEAEQLHDWFTAAQLTTAEIGGAFKAAHNRGYLSAPTLGKPSRVPSRKGGRACAWKRTAKRVPEHLCQMEAA